MKGWAGLEAAADELGKTPDRWVSLRGKKSPASPLNPTLEEIDAGFEIVGCGLAALGPMDDDEPYPEKYGDGDFGAWRDFFARFEDRRAIDAASVRAFVEALDGSPSFPRERCAASWRGLMRAWLRSQLAELTQSIIFDTPPHHVDDPHGLRAATLRGLDRVALLLPDVDQVACLAAMSDVVQLEISDLARRLWHHPNAGPKMKAGLDELFTGNYADLLKAEPPEQHEDAPWILD